MLLDFEYKKGKLIVSEIDEMGDVKFNYYPWRQPKKYVSCDENDINRHAKYHTWDNKPVKLVDTYSPNRYAVYEFLDRLPLEERDRLFKPQEPKMYFVDIETEVLSDGFTEPTVANSKILTIAIVNNRKVMVLGLKDLTDKEQYSIKNKIESHFNEIENIKIDFKYISFSDKLNPEKDMMNFFIVSKATVISGWNFLNYDWTFIINRCKRLGIDPAKTSYTNSLINIFGTNYHVPQHRLIVDYMEIYKKWDTSVKVKENDSLNWVGQKLLKMNHAAKVSYDGTLMDLYNNDFEKYVFYNAVDTVLCQLIHEKMRYIDIAYSISNLSKIRLNDFGMKNLSTALVQTEGFLRERFRDEMNIVFTKETPDEDIETIEGGWVKPPAKGMNEWINTYDFSSLYPTVMRQFNIAPEMYVGKIDKTDTAYAIYENRRTLIDENLHIVCINGTVFRRGESVTVKFLEELFSQRKYNKNLMNDDLDRYDKLSHEISSLEKELEELKTY
jgi:DNA polymerase elongation subunit (family B)